MNCIPLRPALFLIALSLLLAGERPLVRAQTATGQVQANQTQANQAQANQTQVNQIEVNLDARTGLFKPVYAWFGYDEANYTTMPHGRQLLRELHDLSPVPVYIRAHHLLTSGDGKAELKFSSTNIYSEDASGRPVYDFNLIDGIFDAWRDAGVRPMVELGFMPRDLAAKVPGRDEPYQVHFPKSTVSGASNNPPKDYARWQKLCRVLTDHLVKRYGRDEVLKWYFEVWNEPDIDYWHSTREDYFKLYDYAVAGVRSALPEARVGGPATTSPRSEKAREYLRAFLEHVRTGRSAAGGGPVPLDFISFHAKGSPRIEGTDVTMGLSSELKDVDQGFALVASFPQFSKLPIILSEADPEGCAACSSRMNPANNYRNGTLYPAYTAAALKGLLDLEQRHGVNLLSMLSWSFEFEDRDYFEGFRSLATNGLDKPVLNLFRMLGLMSGERLKTTSTGAVPLDQQISAGVRAAPDVDALATRDGNSAAVLVWNYHDVNAPGPEASTRVVLSGFPGGVRRALVEEFRIDETHSNAYAVWQGMGSPQQPTAEQYGRLQMAGQLESFESPRWVDVRDGVVQLDASLPRNSVSLFRVSWN
jgi:xylan 1,4-beta-xylosidase